MGVQFPFTRTVDLGGAFPEPDPNVTPPAAPDVFQLQDRPSAGRLTIGTRGNQVFLEFLDVGGAPVPTASATWQTWFRDERSRRWTNAEETPDSVHMDGWITEDIRGADCFVQIRDPSVAVAAGAAKVVVHMTEV